MMRRQRGPVLEHAFGWTTINVPETDQQQFRRAAQFSGSLQHSRDRRDAIRGNVRKGL
jgi:hypothetical protein